MSCHHHPGGYSHNTPPSTEGEDDDEDYHCNQVQLPQIPVPQHINSVIHRKNNIDSFQRRNNRNFDDEDNITNKSSLRGDGDTISDSFYDPNQARMASIHPRPNESPQANKQNINTPIQVNIA